MKKVFFLFAALCVFSPFIFAAPEKSTNSQPYEYEKSYEYDLLVSGMNGAQAPQIKGRDVVFSAERNKHHFVGIVFDFEQFKVIHPFKIRNTTDVDGNIVKSWFFYVLSPPKNITSIKYRLVIDGLWTIDPLNKDTVFDSSLSLTLSKIDIDTTLPPATREIRKGVVRFVYKGESGQNIRVGGTFTNWDPWIYSLTETESGLYQIDIPLETGVYYYSFYIGVTPLKDQNNPQEAYADDGRTVSVIRVN